MNENTVVKPLYKSNIFTNCNPLLLLFTGTHVKAAAGAAGAVGGKIGFKRWSLETFYVSGAIGDIENTFEDVTGC